MYDTVTERICKAHDLIKTLLINIGYKKFTSKLEQPWKQKDFYNCAVYALVFIRNKAIRDHSEYKIEIPEDENESTRAETMINIRKHMAKEFKQKRLLTYSSVISIPADDWEPTSQTMSLFNPTATNLSTTTTMVYHIL